MKRVVQQAQQAQQVQRAKRVKQDRSLVFGTRPSSCISRNRRMASATWLGPCTQRPGMNGEAGRCERQASS